jgi:hypothetical protein
MVIDVADIADGFVIYETLNDRGAPLTVSDLIRNYLMSRAGDPAGIDLVQRDWTSALLYLGLQNEDNVFVDFLRQLWSSYYGAVREKDLFRAIRDKTNDRASVIAFVEKLPNAARTYAALLDADHELWRDYPAEVGASIAALVRLDVKQFRPLALAVVEHFDPPETVRSVRSLVSWVVRGLITGGIGGGVAERYYGLAAMRVREGELRSADQLLRQLIPIVPTDREFDNSFARARVPKANVARYLMTALERHERGLRLPELVTEDFGAGLRLQHVLPRAAELTDWPGISDEEAKGLVPRVGNLVLLSDSDPEPPRGGDYSDRRSALQRSSVHLTRAVANFDVWTPESIDDRQAKLALRAVSVWPREPQP